MISLAELAPWVAIALSLIVLLRGEFNGRSKEVDIRIGAVAGKIDLLEDRVTIVENNLRHLPNKETTHALQLEVSEMRAEIRGLTEQVKPIAHMASRMQDAILEKVMS